MTESQFRDFAGGIMGLFAVLVLGLLGQCAWIIVDDAIYGQAPIDKTVTNFNIEALNQRARRAYR